MRLRSSSFVGRTGNNGKMGKQLLLTHFLANGNNSRYFLPTHSSVLQDSNCGLYGIHAHFTFPKRHKLSLTQSRSMASLGNRETHLLLGHVISKICTIIAFTNLPRFSKAAIEIPSSEARKIEPQDPHIGIRS